MKNKLLVIILLFIMFFSLLLAAEKLGDLELNDAFYIKKVNVYFGKYDHSDFYRIEGDKLILLCPNNKEMIFTKDDIVICN